MREASGARSLRAIAATLSTTEGDAGTDRSNVAIEAATELMSVSEFLFAGTGTRPGAHRHVTSRFTGRVKVFATGDHFFTCWISASISLWGMPSHSKSTFTRTSVKPT